jgi:hypothetical protein
MALLRLPFLGLRRRPASEPASQAGGSSACQEQNCENCPGSSGTNQGTPTSPSPSSAVDHPHHYNAHPSGVECIDVVEWMPFNIGNAIKYVWRCDHKGKDIEDLEKAVWYLNREIERRLSRKE